MTSTHKNGVFSLFEENCRTLLGWQPDFKKREEKKKKKKKKRKKKRTDNQ